MDNPLQDIRCRFSGPGKMPRVRPAEEILAYLPVRRAARVDPVLVSRPE